jgi:hypothetical protein
MDGFEDRERRFEARFAYDDGLLFRIRALRDRMAGEWAAGLIGLEGADAEVFTARLVQGDGHGPAAPHLRARVIAELRRHGVELSEHRIDKHLDRLLGEARRRIMEG